MITQVEDINPKSIFSSINLVNYGAKLESSGRYIVRYSLVLVLAWIGLMKFTAYEATSIEGLVSSSPFLSWLYSVFSVRVTAAIIGSVELIAVLLLALKPLSARAGIVGGLLASAIFLTTLSFLFTVPGWEASLGGFPALSVLPGQFLIKDVLLLAVSLFLLGDAFKALQTLNT